MDGVDTAPDSRLAAVPWVVRALPWVVRARWMNRRAVDLDRLLDDHDLAVRRRPRTGVPPLRLRRGVDGALRLTGGRRETCVPGSLALWALLSREGRPAVFVSGVRRADGRLESHAWVEVDGLAVGESTAVATFSRQVSRANGAERRRAATPPG